MSTRTIIEINHDELNELYENTSPFKNVLMHLRAANLQAASKEGACAGILILGQRHHSEPEWQPARALDKSELKRLVALVFGEGFQIVGPREVVPKGMQTLEESAARQAISMISNQDWHHWSTRHDAVAIEALAAFIRQEREHQDNPELAFYPAATTETAGSR